MIKADPGHVALFDAVSRDLKATSKRIEAWADDGHPMVVGDTGLVRADSIPGYKSVGVAGDPAPYAFIPGNGWAVQYDDGAVPLVAWAMCTYGGAAAMYAMPVVAEEEATHRTRHIFTMGSPKGGEDGVTVVPISEAEGLRAP